MKTTTPKHITLLKRFFIIPVLALTLYSFSNTAVVVLESNSKMSQPAIKDIVISDKATPEQLAEYAKLVNYYSTHPEVDFLKHLKDMSRIKALYDIMTEAQKKSVDRYPQYPPSLNIFIGDNGQYYINDNEVTEGDIKALLSNFSSQELENTYVFKSSKDFKRYRMKPGQIRSIDDTYIFLFAKDAEFENDGLRPLKALESLNRVQIASKRPKIKSQTDALAQLLKNSGVKHISL